MEKDYTEKDLEKEFGKIYFVELVNYADEDLKNFINRMKKKPNPTKLARLKIIEKHGEKIKKIYLNCKKESSDLCSICEHSSENKYDSTEWMCWRDWSSKGKKYQYTKGSVRACGVFSKHSERDLLTKVQKEMEREMPEVSTNLSSLMWLLKDLELMEFESGWEKANRKSKSFENCVFEDFENVMGFIPHDRWIKINCQKGIRFLQVDSLFTDNNGNAFLIEVKNRGSEWNVPQLKKYWILLKKIESFKDLEFTLFLVSFHEVVNEYGELSAFHEENINWQNDYFLAETKTAPNINFILGQAKYEVNL